MNRIVVTGASGQLGQALQRLVWEPSTDLIALSSTQLDVTDPEAVSTMAADTKPNVIINAAAYTAVDAAEDHPDAAFAVNAEAVGHLADAANRHDAFLIHVSTDYVFDGLKGEPYVEQDPISPIGVYGRSKAAGEAAAATADKAVTLRTSWLYGSDGNNFVSTMLRLASERDHIGVVGDQVGCPTAVPNLARCIQELIEATDAGMNLPSERTYHAVCTGSATWFDLAQAVFDASAAGFSGQLAKLTTSEYPTKATRPPDSRLDCSSLENQFGISLGPWRPALEPVVAELEKSKSESIISG